MLAKDRSLREYPRAVDVALFRMMMQEKWQPGEVQLAKNMWLVWANNPTLQPAVRISADVAGGNEAAMAIVGEACRFVVHGVYNGSGNDALKLLARLMRLDAKLPEDLRAKNVVARAAQQETEHPSAKIYLDAARAG